MTNQKCIICVLGSAQDAGVPQIGCYCENCSRAYTKDSFKRLVSSIAILNQTNEKTFLIDCTPDFKAQLAILDYMSRKYSGLSSKITPPKNYDHNLNISGIFLTHAHMGHYMGLTQLGKEAGNSQLIPVYGTKKMIKFLNSNKPFKTFYHTL